MDKHGIITGFSVLVLVACFLQSNAQKVGTTCTEEGNECTQTSETCATVGSDRVCACADNHINNSTGTCVSKTCDSDAKCTDEKGIANSYCNTSMCACNDLSAVDTTNTSTRGACVKTVCTSTGNQCDSSKNLICGSGGMCACNVSFKLSGKSCVANVINDTCTSDANCAAINNGICDVAASSKTCKTAIGKACVVGNCVMNADCVDAKCACMSGYSGSEGGNRCTANSAGFAIKMNVVGMMLAMVTSVIYVM